MLLLSTDKIKEIAEMLDCGFNCYLNKKSKETIFLTEEQNYFDDFEEGEFDHEFEEPWDADRKAIYENFPDYLKVEKMESSESFAIMEGFAEEVDSVNLQKRLFYALGQQKPFSKFKYIIDDSGDYREQWFAFKSEKIQEWVKEQIDAYNLGVNSGNDEE